MLSPRRVPFLLCASSLLIRSTTGKSFAKPFAFQFPKTSRGVSGLSTGSGASSTTRGGGSVLSGSRRTFTSTKIFSSGVGGDGGLISPDKILGQTIVSIPDALALHPSNIGDGQTHKVKFVDGSWFLADRDGRQEFMDGPRITGAHYFDIDDIKDTTSDLPHMMPPKELFEAAMDSMGITNDDHVIVYGSKDCMFIYRAWFQIQSMGHNKDYCHLLDGSLADWQAGGGPIEEVGSTPMNIPVLAKDLDTTKTATNNGGEGYVGTDAQQIVDLEEMKRLVELGANDADAIWVDVRPSGRFSGEVPEPRPGMRLGHMPGAKNIFFKDLLQDDNVNRLKPKADLEQIFSSAGIDLSTLSSNTNDQKMRIIASCGSGVTACTLITALDICGINSEDCYVYDGSWSEWGRLPDTPIVK